VLDVPARHETTSAPSMRSRRKPTRRNDPLGRRRKILDAAYGMFQERGYNGTSMQDLMEATDITAGALHHHFPTKKALALAVFEERVASVVREAWMEPLRSAASLGEAVQSVFREIAMGIDARDVVRGCPLNNLALELSLVDSDFRKAATAIFDEWQQVLVQRISATRGGRALTRSARSDAAAFIVSAYSGAMTLAKAQQSSRPVRTAARTVGRWLELQRMAG
jgi:TetR/AcrR family transcriptional regulator, transcriptional repressor for nem operon